jgi:hypothetical protein
MNLRPVINRAEAAKAIQSLIPPTASIDTDTEHQTGFRRGVEQAAWIVETQALLTPLGAPKTAPDLVQQLRELADPRATPETISRALWRAADRIEASSELLDALRDLLGAYEGHDRFSRAAREAIEKVEATKE